MAMRNSIAFFFRRLKYRLAWSWAGLSDAWAHQHSFRSWVWAYLATIILAAVLPLTGAERALLLALGLLVLAFEAMNTAVEYTVDYISTERHPLAGRAKDMASAAVFLSSLAAGVAWVSILVSVALR